MRVEGSGGWGSSRRHTSATAAAASLRFLPLRARAAGSRVGRGPQGAFAFAPHTGARTSLARPVAVVEERWQRERTVCSRAVARQRGWRSWEAEPRRCGPSLRSCDILSREKCADSKHSSNALRFRRPRLAGTQGVGAASPSSQASGPPPSAPQIDARASRARFPGLLASLEVDDINNNNNNYFRLHFGAKWNTSCQANDPIQQCLLGSRGVEGRRNADILKPKTLRLSHAGGAKALRGAACVAVAAAPPRNPAPGGRGLPHGRGPHVKTGPSLPRDLAEPAFCPLATFARAPGGGAAGLELIDARRKMFTARSIWR